MNSILLDDSDDELENKEWEQRFSGKSGFIFVIDTRKAMFQGEQSYFMKSFQCCLNAMLQVAREQRYDLVSIVLFGTIKSEGKFAPHGTVLLQPLYTPSVCNIKNIMTIIKDNFASIKEKYGHGKEVSIGSVLNYCKNLLHYCKTKLYTKSIVLFTCDDNPHLNDLQSAHRARKRAEEIREHGIEFDVVGLGSFDSSHFYKELILTTRGELLKDWIGKDPVKKIHDVENEIASLTKKITKHYGIFYLGDSVQMRIMFYKLYQEPQKLIWASNNHERLVINEESIDNKVDPNIKAENDNNVSIFDQDTQEMPVISEDEPSKPPEKDSIIGGQLAPVSKMVPGKSEEEPTKPPEKYPLIGCELIPMSKKELGWFEAKVARGLTLVGFRPISSIPVHLSVDEPYFLLPDSSGKVGEQLFSHLLHSCLRKSVAPICWYSFNRSGKPTLVALYPTEPAEYAKGKMHPYGFHLIKIPFSDMITDYTDGSPEAESSDTQIEAANGIVKKTTINWAPDNFSDYEYNSRIAMIEAIAMEYDDVETVVDNTDVDLEAIGERLGNLSSMLLDCSHLPPEALGKRGANDQPKAPRSKEAKIEDPTFFVDKVKAGQANKLTVAQLRDILKGEGIKSLSALTKPRLVAIANERFCC